MSESTRQATGSFVVRGPALARDLASARRLLPASRTSAELLRRLFEEDIPAEMRALRPTILSVAALMLAAVAAGWWLISTWPELIRLFASQHMISEVEHGRLWTQDIFNVVPSSIESVQILSNNLTVSLLVFCSGLFLGLGVGYFVGLNGLMLGALFAFTHQHGLGGELLVFALAHGPVELSVICIAGAAGMALGESLLRPRLPSRRESFERAAHEVWRVLIACALLLTVCGFIEGFVSPDPRVSTPVRALVGIGYWCVMMLFLSGRLWPRAAAPST